MKRKKVILVSIIATSALAVLASYLIMEKLGVNATQVAQETAVVEEGQQLQPNEVAEEVEETEAVVYVEDTAGIKVPVPKGYVASKAEGEHTVSDGFVIYEGDKDVVDKVVDSNTQQKKEDAQKERNQWVWVPVDNPNEIYGTDNNGRLFGKLYNYDETRRTNCNWTEEKGITDKTSMSSFREPDIGPKNDYDSGLPNYLTEDETEMFEKDMYDDFEEMIESVKKYKGFYIGRYETGDLSNDAKVVKGNADINSQTWYTMYEKSKELGSENENIETSMIWGCLWDATLEWLVDTQHKSYRDVGIDSTSWGNYYNNSITYTDTDGSQKSTTEKKSTIIPTGSSDTTKANNVYDLAGNMYEYTLECVTPEVGPPFDFRVLRGGYYNYSGYFNPADYRGNVPPYYSLTYSGSRAVLYVAL